jgi:O-antigen/teichoic acid export membrane protein
MLGSAEEVGLFRVASTGASLVSFGLTAINLALAPQVARLYQSGDIQKLQRMITLTTRGAVAVSLPVAVVFIVWGRPLIRLMFGIEYLAAATALVVLCIGQLINASCGSVVLVLNMTGNDKATVSSAIVALVLNVILAATLIPSYGLFGAAIGYTASLIAWNIILVVVTKKKTGLKTFLI